jgi:hypothetical protein
MRRPGAVGNLGNEHHVPKRNIVEEHNSDQGGFEIPKTKKYILLRDKGRTLSCKK